MPQLKRLHLENYRSIQNADIEFGRLNVLIGANGSGKSNLISFFKMMNEMVNGKLQHHIAACGRANSILHFGPKRSPQMRADIEFSVPDGLCSYRILLEYAAGDTLFFAEEITQLESTQGLETQHIGGGQQESMLIKSDKPLSIQIRDLLQGNSTYHFHDTTSTSRVRQYGYELDNKTLLFDGGNLAAFLLVLQREYPINYRRIVETVRLVAPYFDDFVLTRTHRMQVYLDWHHMKSDMTFGAHQLSDGTLRAICLITLLLQPPEKLPLVIIVDEPELGLHPYALNLIASLFRAASEHVQVIISTQSSTFLDHFDPEDVIVTEHHDGKSTFHRPGAEKLAAWLEEYSLGEIWEKNVIGGGPH